MSCCKRAGERAANRARKGREEDRNCARNSGGIYFYTTPCDGLVVPTMNKSKHFQTTHPSYCSDFNGSRTRSASKRIMNSIKSTSKTLQQCRRSTGLIWRSSDSTFCMKV